MTSEGWQHNAPDRVPLRAMPVWHAMARAPRHCGLNYSGVTTAQARRRHTACAASAEEPTL